MQTDDSALQDRADLCTDRSATESTGNASLPSSSDSRRAALISAIEGEVVPRLLMLCRSAGAERDSAGSRGMTTDRWDVEELARLLVAHGPDTAWAFVESVRQRGVPHERICLELLAPTAHRLAEQWEHRDFGNPELAHGLDGLLTVLLRIGHAARKDAHVSRHS
jgi:hypothetical protein